MFPAQNQIFVIRSISGVPSRDGPLNITLLEIYNGPIRGETTARMAADRWISDQDFGSFQISDHNLVTQHDHSIQPHLPSARGPPPPVSIFCRLINPHSIQHFMMWPIHVNIPATGRSPARTEYYYSLEHLTFQSRHDCDPNIAHVLPGAYRTLLYTVPSWDRTDNPSLINLRRYIAPETQPRSYPIQKELSGEERVMKQRKLIPSNIFATLTLPKKLAIGLKEYGVTAVAWDEGVGRVCIAAPEEQAIHVLDFAQTPKVV